MTTADYITQTNVKLERNDKSFIGLRHNFGDGHQVNWNKNVLELKYA